MPKIDHKILPNGYGYVALRDMEIKHHKKEFAEAISDLADTPGIIVDIRGNDGGDDDQGSDFNAHFLPKHVTQFYEDVAYSNRLMKDAGKAKLMNGTGLSNYALHLSERQITKPVSYAKRKLKTYTKPVVLIINRYCASTCEGIAKGFSELARSRSQIVGFEGTTGSFGMSGGKIVLPGNIGMEFPFGRSLDKSGRIQIDSDVSGTGGILATVPIPRNATNLVAWVQGRVPSTPRDIELEFAEAELALLIGAGM
jgi:carboxyl-terminal processing protease